MRTAPTYYCSFGASRLLAKQDHSTESTCYKPQTVIPTLEFPFFLYCYYEYLNSWTDSQVGVRPFFLCIFPFMNSILKETFHLFFFPMAKLWEQIQQTHIVIKHFSSLVIWGEPGWFYWQVSLFLQDRIQLGRRIRGGLGKRILSRSCSHIY